MKKTLKLFILTVCIFLFFFVQTIAAEELIVVNFYFSEDCGTCHDYKPIIQQIEDFENFTGKIEVKRKEISTNETNRQEMISFGLGIPSVAVTYKSEVTKVPTSQFTYENLVAIITDYLEGDVPIQQDNIIEIPFLGTINLSSLSLPVLTIILGGVDSLNPCSIFILFILLSLLVYAQSRRRMVLVGGIFIFFSGLWYFVFMFILLQTFGGIEAGILSILIGSIAILFGIINMKDFFFFKKGVSFTIPESKKPGIYKQMRGIIKTPRLLIAIVGTIALAITVNLFELLCSLQWPLYYVGQLSQYNLSDVQTYLYIFLYNVVYVIPLLIILLIFVFSLGRIKLTEWQGQKLKLFSGIMILSFGIIFILDFKLLENVLTPILLLLFSILATLFIASVWKEYGKVPNDAD